MMDNYLELFMKGPGKRGTEMYGNVGYFPKLFQSVIFNVSFIGAFLGKIMSQNHCQSRVMANCCARGWHHTADGIIVA